MIPRRLDPIEEFKALSVELHAAAKHWLKEGYYPPGLTSLQSERLDGWIWRASMAGPEVMTALRKAAGLPPTSVKRRRAETGTQ
jgi:hypothetical protein